MVRTARSSSTANKGSTVAYGTMRKTTRPKATHTGQDGTVVTLHMPHTYPTKTASGVSSKSTGTLNIFDPPNKVVSGTQQTVYESKGNSRMYAEITEQVAMTVHMTKLEMNLLTEALKTISTNSSGKMLADYLSNEQYGAIIALYRSISNTQ